MRVETRYVAAIRTAKKPRFELYYMREGRLIRTKKVSMRCFFPEELQALCRPNGLDVVERFGNYDGSPFTSSSPKQILFCRAS